MTSVAVRLSTVTLTDGPDAAEPGTFLLAWPGGQATVGRIVDVTRGSVTRRFTAVHGLLRPGLSVVIQPNTYQGTPWSALGIAYRSVSVPTPLGGMPAWLVTGRRHTWVLLVHGLDGSRQDVLPVMPLLHALGYPMLAVSYRNDVGAPASPDGLSHLGQTEWRDVAAAVTYAEANGATGVVVFGYSLGGAMCLLVADSSPPSAHVRAVVLDSPLLDWRATLAYHAARHDVPGWFTGLVERMVGWRVGLHYSQFTVASWASRLAVPTLLFQGGADTVVPPGAAARFAADRPGLVTYVPVPAADHVSELNADPGRYRAALVRFLAGYP